MRSIVQDLRYALGQRRKGTLAYRTNRRTAGIGMRRALGARTPTSPVAWLIMRESLMISPIEVMVGLPLALESSRFLDSMLYELLPFDPLSLVLAVSSIALGERLPPSSPPGARQILTLWWL